MQSYDIRTHDLDPIPTIVVRRRATIAQLPRVVPAACGVAWEFIRAKKVRAGRNVALYLSDQVDLEAGADALEPFGPEGEVMASELPGGRVATTRHVGPYAELGSVVCRGLAGIYRQRSSPARPRISSCPARPAASGEPDLGQRQEIRV